MKEATEQQACKAAAVFVEHHRLLAGRTPGDRVQWAIQNGQEFVLLVAQALEAVPQAPQSKLEWSKSAVRMTLSEAEDTLRDMNRAAGKNKWRFPEPEELKRFLQNGFGDFAGECSYWRSRNTSDSGWLGEVQNIGTNAESRLRFYWKATTHEHNKHDVLFVRVAPAAEPKCPKCGGIARNAGKTEFKSTGSKPLTTDLYVCASRPPCLHETTYGGSDWPLEFIMLDGKPHVVEPSASEFC